MIYDSENEIVYTSFLTHGDIIKGNLPRFSSFRDLQWKFVDKIKNDYIGITLLTEGKSCLGLVSINCGLKPVDKNRFLIWERGTTKIDLFDTSDLRVIDNEIKIANELKTSKTKYLFNAKPIDSIEYSVNPFQTIIDINFPYSFQIINEIIQMNKICGMYSDNIGYDNDALVILKPNENKIYLYPQDWYNMDLTYDHGYSWIPRAERNLRTGRIHLDGVRMKSPLILDETYKQLEKI